MSLIPLNSNPHLLHLQATTLYSLIPTHSHQLKPPKTYSTSQQAQLGPPSSSTKATTNHPQPSHLEFFSVQFNNKTFCLNICPTKRYQQSNPRGALIIPLSPKKPPPTILTPSTMHCRTLQAYPTSLSRLNPVLPSKTIANPCDPTDPTSTPKYNPTATTLETLQPTSTVSQ